MVDMAHDGDHGRTLNEVFGTILFLADGLCYLGTRVFGLEAELISHNVDGLGIEALVDAHHDAQVHTGCDNLVDGHIHHACQVVGGHELGELQNLALSCCQCSLLAGLLAHLLAFLTTARGSGLLGVLGGEACQRLLHLALNVFLAHLGTQRTAVALLVLVALAALVVLVATA